MINTEYILVEIQIMSSNLHKKIKVCLKIYVRTLITVELLRIIYLFF